MKAISENGKLTIWLEGRIDTGNAAEIEAQILDILASNEGATPVFDASGLEYISSAGLRVIMAAQKIMSKQGSMSVINASEEVKEIFEVTGFSDILTIA
jgi:anti-sigma B factor antagonist